MKPGKRILLMVILILSALGILSCGAAIGAVWYVNTSLIHAGIESAEKLEALVAVAGKSLDLIDEAILQVASKANRFNDEIIQAKDAFVEREVVLRLMDWVGDKALSEKLQDARDTLENVYKAIDAVSSLIEAAGVSRHGISLSFLKQELEQLNNLLEKILSSMRELETIATESKAGLIQPSVAAITGKAESLRSLLINTPIRLKEVQTKVADTAAALSRLRSRIALYIRLASAALSFILIWLIFAQGCLFYHGYRYLAPFVKK